jgi:5'-nucleotidase
MKITRRDFCRNAVIAPLGASLTGIIAAQTTGGVVTPPLSPVVLTLLHTNDPHGHIYLPKHNAGLVKLATLIRRIRQDMPNVLLLDSGDLIHGTPEEEAFEGRPIIAAMNALLYDAATVGNHEFDFGQRITKQAIGLAQFPLLSANILDEKTGQPWGGLKPYIMREVAGICIAFFGLTTVDTVSIQFPRTLQGIRFSDPIDTARDLVPHLRQKERADVVIFLSHLGYQSDRRLAEALSGIDIILGGHSHNRIEQQVWVNNTLITQTGYHGRALGRTDLLVERDAQGRARVTINGQDDRWWGHAGVPAPLGKTYPTGPLIDPPADTLNDVTVQAVYAPYRAEMARRRAEVLTTTVDALPAQGVKEGQTALGMLLAEAVRRKAGVDIGLVPVGAIVKDLPAGRIDVGMAMDVIGGYTRQHLVTARITGAELRSFVDRALKPGELLMQAAGIEGSGTTLRVNGRLVEDKALYSIAGAAYLIQGQLLGREGVTILNDDPEAPTTREAIVELLRGHAPLNRQTVSPKISLTRAETADA